MTNILKKFKDNNKLKADQVYYNSTTSLLEAMWPIGRGFIDFTNTDYSGWLGFTWERELVGLTPVGLDVTQAEFNTIGKIGGEKVHTLNNDEIPSHMHQVNIGQANNRNCLYWGEVKAGGTSNIWTTSYTQVKDPTISNYFTATSTGGGQAHNNLQPYKVVAYWKRVS